MRAAAGISLTCPLPSFPWADPALLDQYANAFEKVRGYADEIRAQLEEK